MNPELYSESVRPHPSSILIITLFHSLLYRFTDDEMPGAPLGLHGDLKVDTKFLRVDFGGKQVKMSLGFRINSQSAQGVSWV